MKETTKHYTKIFVNIIGTILVLLAIIFVLPRAIYFFLPFIIGWIIARIANPLVAWLVDKIKVKRKAVSAFVIMLAVAVVLFACYGVISILYHQLIGFAEELPQLWKDTRSDFAGLGAWMGDLMDRFPTDIQKNLLDFWNGLNTSIGDWISKISSPTMAAVGNFAMNIPSFLVSLVMCLLSAYFFVAEKDYMNDVAHRFIPKSLQEKWEILKKSFVSAVGGYLKAQLKIEVWMYLILMIGLSILGVNYSLLVALGIAVLDLLPIFGTGTVLIPWALLKIVAGDYRMAIVLLVLWGGGQLLRQLIQPKIVSSSIGLDPIPTLFLLFIGWKIKGVVGMILAVPVGIILMNLYEAGAFDQTVETISIFINDLNAFCRYSAKDRNYYKHYGTTKEAEIDLEQVVAEPLEEEKKREV